MKPPLSHIARRYIVHGSVQGVGYRYFAQKVAQSLKLKGNVRNRDDGSVEVIAVGTAEQLSDLAGRLNQGPPASRVRHVEEHEAAVQQYDSFSIER